MRVMNDKGSLIPKAHDYACEFAQVGLRMIVGIDGGVEDIFNKNLFL